MMYHYLLYVGTCFSFSCEDKSVFVVGCENGSLLKCSLDTSSDISVLTGTL